MKTRARLDPRLEGLKFGGAWTRDSLGNRVACGGERWGTGHLSTTLWCSLIHYLSRSRTAPYSCNAVVLETDQIGELGGPFPREGGMVLPGRTYFTHLGTYLVGNPGGCLRP